MKTENTGIAAKMVTWFLSDTIDWIIAIVKHKAMPSLEVMASLITDMAGF